jgi:hypothetical protein
VAWLRALHRDHGNEPGAFSICVHRDDAATVSYSEILVSSDRVSFHYHPGRPCRRVLDAEQSMRRRTLAFSR